jgi:TRAP-type C4-dicarboxylate transport system permease large subunit
MLMPLILSLGMDPLQYGIMVTLSQAIGQQTPPMASVLLTVSAVSDVSVEEMTPWVGIYVLVFLIVLLVVTFVPAVSLLIPRFMST